MNYSNETSRQSLRSMALRAQLLAVEAQASALREMDREHSFGLETSREIEWLRSRVHQFATNITAFVDDCRELSEADARQKLLPLVGEATRIKINADQLNVLGAAFAKDRYKRATVDFALDEAFAEPGKADESVQPGAGSSDRKHCIWEPVTVAFEQKLTNTSPSRCKSMHCATWHWNLHSKRS